MSTIEQAAAAPFDDFARRRRSVLSAAVYLALVGLAIWVLLPQFVGQDRDKVEPLLRQARPEWLTLALLFASARYVCVGLAARQIASILGTSVRRRDSAQMMLSSYAVNRIFSAGGLSAAVVRIQFWMRCGFPLGRIVGLFITHNMLSGLALLLTFLISVRLLWQRGDLDGPKLLAALGWIGVILAVAGAQVYIAFRPAWLERGAGWWLRKLEGSLRSMFGRGLYNPEGLRKVSGDLVQSAHIVLRGRRGLGAAFGYQGGALASEIMALFLVFQALQVPVEPAVVLSGYIVAYYAQLIAPTPGEAGAMEFSLPIVLVGLGLSPLYAATTTLLFRFLSFWLPIPFGLAAYFNLKRQGMV